jgi:hypothetical protein
VTAFSSARLDVLFRQRAQLQASQRGEEAARARAHADGLSRQLHEKETEIADLIGALRAASQSLLSADTIRQLNDHPGAIGHLERADGRAATLIPELSNLRTAINNQSRLIGSPNIARTDSPDTREDHDPAFPPNAGKPVGGTP